MTSRDPDVTVKFWGVRGSVPAPITPAAVEAKIVEAVLQSNHDRLHTLDRAEATRWARERLTFATRSTYGGNTTCVELRLDGELVVFDMGTGIREMGTSHLKETLANRGQHGTILQSHVHWDHIQGYPFWPQLYMPRKVFDNRFTFYGGEDWGGSLHEVLRYQMSKPMFPVGHGELENTGMRMTFTTVHDGKVIVIPTDRSQATVLCRKLHHPQDTYGYRVEYRGKTVVFCTDHEPYPGLHRPLLELAEDADVFITDCQYDLHQYRGDNGGVQKFGWGHSYPEYVAEVAKAAGVKRVITTHHDPASNDDLVSAIGLLVSGLSDIPAEAAYEGMIISV